MSKVFSAHAASVDGYISGSDPSDDQGGFGRGLGDAPMLFDWYLDGDTPSRVFGGAFRLSAPSARIFDTLAALAGAVVAGRTTYEHSSHWDGGSPNPAARLVVLSHRSAEISDQQTLVTTGIRDAIASARELAEDKDVALMGGGVLTAALEAGLVDEVILHQVPIVLGRGRPCFQVLPAHVRLRLREAIPAPGVTHLLYEVER